MREPVDEVARVAPAEGIDAHLVKGGTIMLARNPVQWRRAQQEGNLVLFVGAGASMAPPSALPSFTTLARSIPAAALSPLRRTPRATL